MTENEKTMAEIIALQKVRISQLEDASMKLYDMVHKGNLIELNIKANDLYDTIKPDQLMFANCTVYDQFFSSEQNKVNRYKMDIKQVYREETNLEVYTTINLDDGWCFRNDYVKWLEAKINYTHCCLALKN